MRNMDFPGQLALSVMQLEVYKLEHMPVLADVVAFKVFQAKAAVLDAESAVNLTLMVNENIRIPSAVVIIIATAEHMHLLPEQLHIHSADTLHG